MNMDGSVHVDDGPWILETTNLEVPADHLVMITEASCRRIVTS